jgi:chromate transporter
VPLRHDVSARDSGKPDNAGVRHLPEVLRAFTKLGLTAFGGPIAHLGYFREEFVVRRRWLDEQAYADLVSLCQFLPGPASSQLGFSLGLLRAGYLGGIAAWLAFTLPSALLMVALAVVAHWMAEPAGVAVLQGLKLVAVAIVAQAVWGMARGLCPDWPRRLIATAAAALVIWLHAPVAQFLVILVGCALGLALQRRIAQPAAVHLPIRVSRRIAWAALALFVLLLAGLPLLRLLHPAGQIALFEAFYRSGALVFGGGHVVLPLLNEAVVGPGWVSGDDFLAGYGMAQAVPGPLFTFAAYLGAIAMPAQGALSGAALGLVGIFLPGMLLLIGVLPFWQGMRERAFARGAMAGINAAVVGLLAAALYTPLWTSAVHGIGDGALAVLGTLLLIVWRVPPLVVVGVMVTAAWVLARAAA